MNKLTFWRHQVVQQVSAYDLCWKAVEKRCFLFDLQQDALNTPAVKEQFGVKEGYLLLDQTCQKVLLESPTLEEKPQQRLNYHHNSTLQAVFRFTTSCQLLYTCNTFCASNKTKQMPASTCKTHARRDPTWLVQTPQKLKMTQIRPTKQKTGAAEWL